MSNAPYSFYDIMRSESSYAPSTVHVNDDNTYNFFYKYLIQRVMSVYKWQLPEQWSKRYFMYTLYEFGYIAIINTREFGVVPQMCSLTGYNLYYEPSAVIVTNPLVQSARPLKIGSETELIKLQPGYSGVHDIVDRYAQKLNLLWQAIDINVINSKLAYVFIAGNKANAESFKKIYDDISKGNTAVFVDKNLKAGGNGWQLFNNNLKQNYIVDMLLQDTRTVVNMFDTEIGIKNSNTQKKERMLTDEVNSNNEETYSLADLWLENMQEDIKKVNKMFNLDLKVEYRFGGVDDGIHDNKRNVDGEAGPV